ncbi:D-lactate dehydrogenase [cytochrome] 1, mitochondrial [[Candida] anglica]|uniref:D-lactate dehydrogenase (cytochrome) n=1 Tax=[Candida] anglica TaxID=148631 RepID=A0ABP0ECI5_9ASCO
MFRPHVLRTISRIGKQSRMYSSGINPSASRTKIATQALIFSAGAIFGATLLQYESNPKKSFETPNNNEDISSTLSLEKLPSPTYANDEEIELAIKEIRNIIEPVKVESAQELITNSKEQLDSHSDTYFNSHHPSPEERPKYVVYPQSTEHVSKILAICHKYRVPIVPISGASSLEGHFIPTRGGISLDLTSMDQIIQLNKDDLDMTVQTGVGWEGLADYLEPYNLMFGPDPGPGATIGGMCATNCSGTNASRYGECYKNILSLTVVLADGTIVKTRQRPKKSSAGYNLTSLFIGSEGTLGVITEATLKLYVKPIHESVAVVPFSSIENAASAVNSILHTGIQLNAVELLDDKMMKCINDSGETSRKWTESPTLFLKIGGSNQLVVDSLVQQLKSIVKSFDNEDFIFASSEDEKTELWSARKVALWSTINQGKQQNENIQLWTTDAAVPISKLPQFLHETKADIDSHNLQNTLVAHIGDGNAHSFILYEPSQRDIAEKVVNNMVRRAIKFEGTCTGEHGVGFGKRDFLLEEIGVIPVDLMRRIKLSLDPLRILNPDKIFKIDPNEPPEKHDHGDIEHGEVKTKM